MKTKSKKPAPAKRVKPRAKPPLSKLQKMSQPQRQALFVKWVKRQSREKSYSYFDTRNCALAQFGKTIKSVLPFSQACCSDLYFESKEKHRLYDTIAILEHDRDTGAIANSSTFGELADKLSAV